MAVGRDGQRVIAPNNVERHISEWVTRILAEKKRTGSFGTVSVELTVKDGEVDLLRYSDHTTVKVDK